MIYPIVVVAVAVAILTFIMIKIVPSFQKIFEDFGLELPDMTLALVAVSEWCVDYWYLIPGIPLTIWLTIKLIRKFKAGRMGWDQFVIKVPVFGNLIEKNIMARTSRTLGTLMANGVPVLQALGIVERTVGNVVIGREIAKARERVTDGTTISGPFAASAVFPSMLTDMLSIGEQTGDMATALTHIARRYENELDRNVTIFTTALEPILIVVVAVLVGFVAISILMAVFNLTNGLNV